MKTENSREMQKVIERNAYAPLITIVSDQMDKSFNDWDVYCLVKTILYTVFGFDRFFFSQFEVLDDFWMKVLRFLIDPNAPLLAYPALRWRQKG